MVNKKQEEIILAMENEADAEEEAEELGKTRQELEEDFYKEE